MRPKPQGFLRYPISNVLGAEASVRVLRELALHGDELTTTALAARAGLSDQSVRNVIGQPSVAAMLRTYGSGRAVSYQLDGSHSVAQMLIELFRSEDDRLRALRHVLSSTAKSTKPTPAAVWLYGSTARGEDSPESDIDILLVADCDTDPEAVGDTFREKLGTRKLTKELPTSVLPVSTTDVLRMAQTQDSFWNELLHDAVSVHGPSPEALARVLLANSLVHSDT